eukprot:8801778-Pyramimonas_sp.AAC.1
MRRAHADAGMRAFGGTSCGATKRVRGAPKQRRADDGRKDGMREEEGRKEAGTRGALVKARTRHRRMAGNQRDWPREGRGEVLLERSWGVSGASWVIFGVFVRRWGRLGATGSGLEPLRCQLAPSWIPWATPRN